MFGKQKIIFIDGQLNPSWIRTEDSELTAFLTWYLIGECDDAVVSEYSSFGLTATSRYVLK
jgi:hypothetical protein